MSEFLIQIEKLLNALADPEFRYLALEPVISYGLLVGVALLAVGFLPSASRLRLTALVVIGVAALTYTPYKEARVAAQPRMEKVYRHSAASRVEDFAANTKAWSAASWQFRFLVLAAFGAVLVGAHRGSRMGFVLSILTFFLGLFAMKSSMWLNYQDALAYHPNLKQHEAPVDRRSADRIPPPSRSSKRERTPAAPRAEPVAPAGISPSGAAAARADRIQAPTPPGAPRGGGTSGGDSGGNSGGNSGGSPGGARAVKPSPESGSPKIQLFKRKVEPLPRF